MAEVQLVQGEIREVDGQKMIAVEIEGRRLLFRVEVDEAGHLKPITGAVREDSVNAEGNPVVSFHMPPAYILATPQQPAAGVMSDG